jgi:hypothetical protein
MAGEASSASDARRRPGARRAAAVDVLAQERLNVARARAAP